MHRLAVLYQSWWWISAESCRFDCVDVEWQKLVWILGQTTCGTPGGVSRRSVSRAVERNRFEVVDAVETSR